MTVSMLPTILISRMNSIKMPEKKDFITFSKSFIESATVTFIFHFVESSRLTIIVFSHFSHLYYSGSIEHEIT
jgi:hypothetical protein